MSRCIGLFIFTIFVLLAAASASWADCASDCSGAYRSCRGNPDTCLSQQGVCLARCGGGAAAVRHGAIAYSERKEVYGYSKDFGSAREAASAAVNNCRKEDVGAGDCKVVVTFHNACGALALGNDGAYGSAWAMSQREASSKALVECRPYGGTSCKVESQVCSGAR
jgi:serine/threonine-protein kinase